MPVPPVPPPLPGERCPYVLCPYSVARDAVDTCRCESRCPIMRCPACAISNRADAQYCRACQANLSAVRPASKIAVSAVDFIQVPGEYYYPPVIHHGFLWCLSTAGAVVRVSPRGGAKP